MAIGPSSRLRRATGATIGCRSIDWLLEGRNETLLSAIVVAVLTFGIRPTAGARQRAMHLPWRERLIARHEHCGIPFELVRADTWPGFAMALISKQRVGSRRFATLIAAHTLTLGMPLATRNRRAFEDSDLVTVNPWEG